MDWLEWHEAYADLDSPLSHRLRLVQQEIDAWLTANPDRPVRVVSACAGQGRDLIEVLAARPDAGRVSATLIEFDERNIAAARASLEAAGLDGVSVVRADAGQLSSYAGAVPADLVLLVGVLGNITDDDVHHTVASLPQLCADGATVIWTRTRAAPDLTPAIRQWFAEAGFAERAFHAPDGVLFTVGAHTLTAPAPPLTEGPLFTFVR